MCKKKVPFPIIFDEIHVAAITINFCTSYKTIERYFLIDNNTYYATFCKAIIRVPTFFFAVPEIEIVDE